MKILLIDDHELFREGLKLLIRSIDESILLSEANDCESAIDNITLQPQYDLILLDLNLPGIDGIEAISAILRITPKAPIVILSGEEHPNIIRESIYTGAMGFIPKSSNQSVLIQAIKLVVAGGIYLPPSVIEKNAPPENTSTKNATLSSRQLEVLNLMIEGLPNKTIAHQLNISESTVKSHVSTIMKRLNAKNRTEAVYHAAKLNLGIH